MPLRRCIDGIWLRRYSLRRYSSFIRADASTSCWNRAWGRPVSTPAVDLVIMNVLWLGGGSGWGGGGTCGVAPRGTTPPGRAGSGGGRETRGAAGGAGRWRGAG